MLELDGYRIEIFERQGSAVPSHPTLDPSDALERQGLQHVAFTTPDLEGLVRELQARGVRPVVKPAVNELLNVRYCFVQDVDGVLIELAERV